MTMGEAAFVMGAVAATEGEESANVRATSSYEFERPSMTIGKGG